MQSDESVEFLKVPILLKDRIETGRDGGRERKREETGRIQNFKTSFTQPYISFIFPEKVSSIWGLSTL